MILEIIIISGNKICLYLSIERKSTAVKCQAWNAMQCFGSGEMPLGRGC